MCRECVECRECACKESGYVEFRSSVSCVLSDALLGGGRQRKLLLGLHSQECQVSKFSLGFVQNCLPEVIVFCDEFQRRACLPSPRYFCLNPPPQPPSAHAFRKKGLPEKANFVDNESEGGGQVTIFFGKACDFTVESDSCGYSDATQRESLLTKFLIIDCLKGLL